MDIRLLSRGRVGERRAGLLLVAVGLAATAGVCASLASARASVSPEVKAYATYIHGKPGVAADSSLSPVTIGWATNGGGSIIPINSDAAKIAQFTVDYINKNLGGIGGHPLALSVCYVKNAEEEGQKCAQQFLNDPKVPLIAYGSMAVGANTINSTVKGKKPIFVGFSFNASDVTTPNAYIFYTYVRLAMYGWGTFGRDVLHAKTGAVVYPTVPGITDLAAAVAEASNANGIKTKLVGFNPNSTDLTGALTAAGAQKADIVSPILVSPSNCLSFYQAAAKIGIKPSKMVGFFDCNDPKLKSQYPDGDFAKGWYGIAQQGNGIANNAKGKLYKAALATGGYQDKVTDPWWSGMFGLVMTLTRMLNEIGPTHITPASVSAKAKVFKGPVFAGAPFLECGKYPKFPNACADGAYFFKYLGNGKYKRFNKWFQPPLLIQKKYGVK